MKITLFTWSWNGYRKSGMVGLFRLLPVEYASNVDVFAHSVAIHLFGSTSMMIHSISTRKRLPHGLLICLWPQWWLLCERFNTLDIFLKTKTKTLKCASRPSRDQDMCRETSHSWLSTSDMTLRTSTSAACRIDCSRLQATAGIDGFGGVVQWRCWHKHRRAADETGRDVKVQQNSVNNLRHKLPVVACLHTSVPD